MNLFNRTSMLIYYVSYSFWVDHVHIDGPWVVDGRDSHLSSGLFLCHKLYPPPFRKYLLGSLVVHILN